MKSLKNGQRPQMKTLSANNKYAGEEKIRKPTSQV